LILREQESLDHGLVDHKLVDHRLVDHRLDHRLVVLGILGALGALGVGVLPFFFW